MGSVGCLGMTALWGKPVPFVCNPLLRIKANSLFTIIRDKEWMCLRLAIVRALGLSHSRFSIILIYYLTIRSLTLNCMKNQNLVRHLWFFSCNIWRNFPVETRAVVDFVSFYSTFNMTVFMYVGSRNSLASLSSRSTGICYQMWKLKFTACGHCSIWISSKSPTSFLGMQIFIFVGFYNYII